MNATYLNWLRWVLLVPTSIGLGILYAIYGGPLITYGWDQSIDHASSPFIASAIAILAAYHLAPFHKFRASLAVAFLWLMAPIIGSFIIITDIKVEGEEQYLVDGGVAMLSTFLGIVASLYANWVDSRKASFKFKETRTTACIVCSHVMYRERPILYASNVMDDGYWQFLCGFDEHSEEDLKIISLEEATIIDPSINDVYAMPVGTSIERHAVGEKWKS
jgi:hypothetical protein